MKMKFLVFDRIRQRPHARRGATMVEFAFVAPILLLILFTCLEFIRVEMIHGLAQDAAYEAARTIMVPGAKKQEAIAEANRILGIIGARSVTVNVQAFDTDGEQSEINDDTRSVSVSVEVPISNNALIFPLFTGNGAIEATSSLTFESYSGYYDGLSN